MHASRDRSVLPLALAAGALIGQQVAARATRDALFLSSFAVDRLPWAMGGSAVLSLGAVFALARASTRFTPRRVVPVALAASGALLLGEWLLALARPPWAALALYLHVGVFGATLVSGFWALVSETLDPRRARHAMAPVGTGANLGAVAGGLLAFAAARVTDLAAMFPMLAALHLLCLGALRGLPAAARPEPSPEFPDVPSRAGLRLVRETPYLGTLAGMMALAALVQAVLDYLLGVAATEALPSGAPLMSFFAVFHTGVSVAGLAVQAAAGRVALDRLGLAGTVALHPASVVVAAAAALLSPRLWSAVLLRAVEAVMRNSLFRSGYELLYTPLPPQKTRPTKAIIDVGFDRVGTAAGSLLVLAVLAVAPAPRPVLVLLAAVAAGGGLLLVPRLHRGYVSALAESLRSGAVRLQPDEVVDATTRWTLAETKVALDRQTLLREIEALRSGATPPPTPSSALSVPARRADPLLESIEDLRSGDLPRVRTVLAGTPEPAVVHWVLPLLAREEHFADALRYLRACAARAAGQLVDAMLDPAQPELVRRRIPRVLRAVPHPRVVEGLLAGLEAPGLEVRSQCALALLRLKEQRPELATPRERAFQAALAELERAGDDVSERRLEHVFALLALALEREPLQLALRAVRGTDMALRGTALEYLENVLPEALRQKLGPVLGEGPLPPPSRSPSEAREELLRSSTAWARPRGPSRGR